MKTFKTYIIERKKTKRDVPDNDEHQLLHTDDTGTKIYKLNTFKASNEIYAGGAHKGYPKTDWCTAKNCSNFDLYSEDAPLYVIHSKDEHGNPQVHQFNDGPLEMSFNNAKDKAEDFGTFSKAHPDIVKHIKFSTKESEEQFNKDLHTSAIQSAKNLSNSTYGFLDKISRPDRAHLIFSPHLSDEDKNLIINTPHKAVNLLTRSSALTDDDAKNILSKEWNATNASTQRNLMNNILENSSISKEYHNELFNKFLTHSKSNGLMSGIDTSKISRNKHFSDEHANALLDHSDIIGDVSKVGGILYSEKLKPETISRVMKEYSSHPYRNIVYGVIISHDNVTKDHLNEIINNTQNPDLKTRATKKLDTLNKDQ